MNSKKIKIVSSSLIWAKGGISGPILTPYVEDEATILQMIKDGIEVIWVGDDGSEVPLNIMNYDAPNPGQADVKPMDIEVVEAVKEEPVVVEQSEVKVDEPKEFNKKNKKDKHNQPQVETDDDFLEKK